MEYSTTEFETLYIQCFPPSMRLAMSLLHEEDEARDVVQEVFLKLWESDIRVENPLAFIIRSVRNACLNRISLLDTRDKILRRIMLDPYAADFDDDSRSEEVRHAIQKLLTPREQDVVERIYGDGLSYKDAAENLDVSVATINKNIVSALKKLKPRPSRKQRSRRESRQSSQITLPVTIGIWQKPRPINPTGLFPK